MAVPEDTRDSLEFDVLVVGSGPSGLAAAIRIRQLAAEKGEEISVCLIEKAAEVGLHTLSGAVVEPRALAELFPDYLTQGAPLDTPVSEDRFLFLTQKRGLKLPVPPTMRNHGNYITQLGKLCQWLAEQAESLGVEIFPNFAGFEPLVDDKGVVVGVRTGDMGRERDGSEGANFQAGVDLRARYTLFAEGCRGHNTQKLIQDFDLQPEQPQTYGIGIKELWRIPEAQHQRGAVWHSIGWPLKSDTYGGSFIYHLSKQRIALGFVVGLDYRNPYLNPFRELQRFKHHPVVHKLLEGGERLCYGARALNEGGYQSIPKLVFPGGALIGCGAGFLNAPKIKGTHTAMKSGMVAAEAVVDALLQPQEHAPSVLQSYPQMLKQSWLWDELYRARNVRPSFRWGLGPALLYAGLDQILLRGKAPWTLKHHGADHLQTGQAQHYKAIDYPQPDGKISFDLNSSLYLSGTTHEANQPCHLRLRDETIPVSHNLALYDGLEQRYCPAGVYEYVEQEGERVLQINAQNCLHCKTCDIKDPTQNVHWVSPEGGGGPAYQGM